MFLQRFFDAAGFSLRMSSRIGWASKWHRLASSGRVKPAMQEQQRSGRPQADEVVPS
jgi:hypothetical protein